MPTFALRISCPDRPGTLGAVAGALGRMDVDIVSLDVVERTPGLLAADDLVVEGPVRLDELVTAVDTVPDVVVELVHSVPQLPDRRGALEVAAALARATPDGLLDALVDGVVEAFNATWSVVVRERSPQPERVAASQTAPTLIGARLPWLPVESCRRLTLGPWVPDRWPLDPLSASFAVARLGEPIQTLLVARARGPLFRVKELRELEQLAKIAATLGDGRLAPS